MANCRSCRWYKIDVGNPTKGLCIYGSYQQDEKEAASGVAGSVVPGKLINGSDEACDNYEDRPSRAQRLKEGV